MVMPNPTDAAVALLPCPWCKAIPAGVGYHGQPATSYFVKCACGASGPEYDRPEGAIIAWSTRAQAPAAGEWLPIESAPTERDVLVYAPESPFPYRVASLCEHVQGWIWLDINADRIDWPVVAWRELTPPNAAMTGGLAGGGGDHG